MVAMSHCEKWPRAGLEVSGFFLASPTPDLTFSKRLERALDIRLEMRTSEQPTSLVQSRLSRNAKHSDLERDNEFCTVQG